MNNQHRYYRHYKGLNIPPRTRLRNKVLLKIHPSIIAPINLITHLYNL